MSHIPSVVVCTDGIPTGRVSFTVALRQKVYSHSTMQLFWMDGRLSESNGLLSRETQLLLWQTNLAMLALLQTAVDVLCLCLAPSVCCEALQGMHVRD